MRIVFFELLLEGMLNRKKAAKALIPAQAQASKIIIIFAVFFMCKVSLAQEKLGIQTDEWAQAQIKFWTKIFTDYTTKEGVLHDSANLKYVYRVIPSNMKFAAEEKEKVREALLSIVEKKVVVADLTPEEMRIYEILGAQSDPRTYQFAADSERIRFQLGQKDRLENAFAISKRYLKRMEEMFLEEGVPKELTRLPFVESGFVNNARSSVGALGIWQFMPKTAMKDLRVDSLIDERRDPLKSTRAAARYLKMNYRLLKSWPLAVMAYHHGPALVMKACKKLKTRDPLVIVRLFKDPNFKFASRNYLFEFLAMLEVDAKHALFFKTVAPPLPEFITVSFQKKRSVLDVLKQLKLNPDEIRILNPHFEELLWSGKQLLPAHYPIRLSGISLEDFRKASML